METIDVKKFIADYKSNNKKRPARSRLFQFENEIKEMREAGLPYRAIQEFLELNGLKVTHITVRDFFIRHLNDSVIENSVIEKKGQHPKKESVEVITETENKLPQTDVSDTNKLNEPVRPPLQNADSEFRSIKRKHKSPLFPSEVFDSPEYKEKFAQRSAEADRKAKENIERDAKIAREMGLTLSEYQQKLREEHQKSVPKESWITGQRVQS